MATTSSSYGLPAFGTEEQATPINHVSQPAANSPILAADPSDDRFVALANRLDSPDYGCDLELSGDGGRHWLPVDVFSTLPDGAEKCFAPELAFDRRGRLYYLFVGLAGAGNRPMGAFLTFSDDRGRTFSAPRRVLGPLSFGVRMALDTTIGKSGRIHLVWLQAVSEVGLGSFGPPPNPIMSMHSDDGGHTFSQPLQVSDPDRDLVIAPALALGPDHAVYVAYYDLGEDRVDYYGLEGNVWQGTWSVVLATSTDGGAHFGRGRLVDGAIVPSGRVMVVFTMPPPALVAGPGRRVCAAWTDARHGDPDVMARCAPDGRAWGGLRRLNDDPAGNGLSQTLPRLGVAPNGRIDAVFLDRRDDSSNFYHHSRFTFSVDGGRTWAPTRRLSTEASDSRIGQRYALVTARGQTDFGARLGLLSRPDGAVAAWPDTRFSKGRGRQQQVMTTTVEFPRRHRTWMLGPAAALAGVGAGLVIAARRQPRVKMPIQGSFPEPVAAGRRVTVLRIAGGAVAVAVAVVVLAQLLSTVPNQSDASLPPPPQRVKLTMSEYRYDFVPPSRPGRVIFDVHNAGKLNHQMLLFPMMDVWPPINEQLHGSVRNSFQPLAVLPDLKPGERASYAVDVGPKVRYAIVCFLESADGEIHGLKGMNAEILVRDGAGGKAGSP